MLPSVLIVHNRYRYPGGEERIVSLQRGLLASNGHRVDLYEEDSAAFARRSILSRVGGMISMPFSLRHYAGLRRKIREFRPSVVHIHNAFPLLTPSVYHAARSAGVPVVQSVHNYRFLCSNGLFLLPSGQTCERCKGGAHWNAARFGCYAGSRLRSLGMAATLMLHRRALRTIPAAFLSPSEFLRQKLIEGGFPSDRIHRMPPGLGGEAGEAAPEEKTLLYVGRLSPEKGVSVLIGAARELPDWKVLIAGQGPQEESLKRDAAELRNVSFLGSLPREDVDALYRKATAIAAPSVCYENLPSVVVEAWRFGVPAVVSKIGGMAELVEDGKTGFHFTPGESGDLARTVRQLTPDRVRSMRPLIKQRVEKDFGKDAFYRKLAEVYRQVTGQQSA